MEHIRSRTFGDCGVCCAAMIANTSYANVMSKVRLRTNQGVYYLDMPEIFAFLASMGVLPGLVIQPPGKFKSDADVFLVQVPINMDALVTVPGVKEPFLHFVVWDGAERVILDPNLDGPTPAEMYDIREWAPMKVWKRFE